MDKFKRRRFFAGVVIILAMQLSPRGQAEDLDFLNASYTVPVSSALLDEAAFPLTNVNLRVDSGQQVLQYRLPDDLVGGQAIAVDFAGPVLTPGGGFVSLNGIWGTTSCRLTTQLSCLTQYDSKGIFGPNLDEVLAANRAYLTQKYGSAPDLAKRIAVAMAFGNDPGGVVAIPARSLVRFRSFFGLRID